MLVDTAGRVERFNKRFAKTKSMKTQPAKED
jgi:ribosomal protein L31